MRDHMPPEERARDRARFPKTGLLIGGSFVAGTVLGIAARIVFEQVPSLQVMSIAFLFVQPFVIGVLTGLLSPPSSGLLYRIFFPLAPIAAYGVGALLLHLEGLICLVMMMPVGLVCGAVGGLVSLAIAPLYPEQPPSVRSWPRKPFVAVLALPLLVGIVEEQTSLPEQAREVWTRIDIDAGPEAVWPEIVSVPRIEPSERRPRLVHAIGFPYPVEATIDREGVGAVRLASFEGGIVFREVVTDWEPQRRIAFSIDVDADSIPTTTLDRHVTIGGAWFDTLDGTYRIEPRDDGTVTLHLGSRHRLSTRFNVYAGLWTDWIMTSIQEEILEIVRDRAERR